MRKRTTAMAWLAVLLVVSVLTIGGCAQPSSKPAVIPAGFERITLVNSSMGSSTQALLVAYSRVLGKYYPEISWAVRTGSSAANPARLTDGSITVAHAGFTHYIESFGEGKDDESKLRALWFDEVSEYFLVVPKDSSIENARDLPKGISLSAGSPGTTGPVGLEVWLEAYGLKRADFKWNELGKSAAAAAWRDGTIAAFWTGGGGIPAPWTTEFALSKQGYKVVKSTEDEMKKVEQLAIRKGFAVGEIPLKEEDPAHFTYNTWGLRGPSFLSAREDFPKDIAYNIARILTEHHDELVSAYRLAERSTAEGLIKYSHSPFKLHAGVEEYFKEKGLLK